MFWKLLGHIEFMVAAVLLFFGGGLCVLAFDDFWTAHAMKLRALANAILGLALLTAGGALVWLSLR